MKRKNLLKLFKKNNLKTKDVAKELNISTNTLYKKCRGESEFTISEVVVLSKILEISVEELIMDVIYFEAVHR